MIKRALAFLQLTDENGNLSLTNIILIAMAVNLMLDRSNGMAAAGLATAIINFCHQRYQQAQTLSNDSTNLQDIDAKVANNAKDVQELTNKISTLSSQVNMTMQPRKL